MSSYMSVIGGNDVTLIWTSQVRFDEGGRSGMKMVGLPHGSGEVIAWRILKDLLGIELPVYFFGSGTVCSLGWT